MSENAKTKNDSERSCLHCRVHNSKQHFQEIFDEVGIDIELPDLLAKYFHINVKPDPQKQQLLCQECVKTLIRFFDIDELQREQDAANAAKKQAKQPEAPSTAANDAAKKEVKGVKKQISPANKAKSEPKKLPVAVKLAAKPKLAKVVVTEESASIRVTRAKTLTVTPKAKPKPIEKSSGKTVGRKSKEAGAGEQEQISELLRDILDDEKAASDDKFAEAAATVRQLETQAVQEKEQQERQQEENTDELEFLLEQEDASSDMDVQHFKVENYALVDSSQSQTEDESVKVEPFNFVLIKESDDIDDLYEYLSTVVRTCFETLTFEWSTVCCHCSLKCQQFESLLGHMHKCHQLPEERFKCPIANCNAELQGSKYLAMHLVVLHAAVADIPIYGCCPECNMTFSNILQYNKHSCARVIKKRRGIRLYCEMCGLEFPSWKRFNFHNQFHLERHRPRACFVCNYADTNIDDLFQHLHYSHEPEGTLFCDICDRNFRDATVFAEHNKCHSNVTSTTYTCTTCSANFDTRGRLNGHIRARHGSIISCELCSREFATEATYNIHMKKHLIIEREIHYCSNCGQLSENHDKMLAHVEDASTDCFNVEIYVELIRDAYVCEYCSCYFRQKTDLRDHRDSGVHKDNLFWCQPCGKAFNDMKLYRHHLRNYQQQRADVEHRKLEVCLYFMCDYEDCFEAYINWNSLYTHKRRTHDGLEKQEGAKPNEWICQFCQKECRSKMSLSVHVARSHNNNNVTCTICKSSYKDDEALKKHHAYWHEPMECALCLKVVKSRRNFDTHMNVVHSNNKRYTCNVCEKGFFYKSEMEAHKRLHTQLFECDQCSFTTRNKKSLAVHVLGQHYKRFAFECKTCNKRFGRRQGLISHVQRIHGSNNTCRDFFENGCSKSFSTTAKLNVHVRKAHNGTIFLTDLDDEELQEEEQELEQQKEQEEEQAEDEQQDDEQQGDEQPEDEQPEEEQPEEEQAEAKSQKPKAKRQASPEATTSKKRCVRRSNETQEALIPSEHEEEEEPEHCEDSKKTKNKSPLSKRKKKVN